MVKYPWIELVCHIQSSLSNDRQKQFNLEAYVVANTYYRVLRCADIKYLHKIRIDLTPDKEQKTFIEGYSRGSEVLRIMDYYDFNAFFGGTIENRQTILLDLIQEKIEMAGARFSWDLSPFREAYAMVKEIEFRNEYLVKGKMIDSPDKSYRTGVKVSLKIRGTVLSIVLFDKNNLLLHEEYIATLFPHHIFIDPFVKHIKWQNKTNFFVSNFNKSISFTLSVTDKKLSSTYNTDEISPVGSSIDSFKYLG